MNETFSQVIGQRIMKTALITLVAVVVLQWRLYDLQVVKHEVLAEAGRIESKRNITWKPDRGVILDRNMRLLVWNSEKENLVAHPAKIKEPKRVAGELSPVLGVPGDQLEKRLTLPREEIALQRRISAPQADAIRKLNLEGIDFSPEPARCYLKGELASQLIGYVNIDNQGAAGIEKSEESRLAGKVINVHARRMGDRKAILDFDYMREVPLRGADVVLTIDETIQWISEKALGRMCETYNAKSGMAVVMEPQTGEVLAMANYPFFDADHLGDYYLAGQRDRDKNHCITNRFEPGSTIKPFVVAAGLDSGAIQIDSIIDCEGGSRYLPPRIRPIPIRDEHRMGKVPVGDVLVFSSNIGVGKIAEAMEHFDPTKPSREMFYNYLVDFGFGGKTGIDLPGEVEMVLKDWKTWNLNDMLVVAFGTGPISVSPIGLASAYCVLANGGVQVTPHIIKGYVSSRNGNHFPSRPKRGKRVVREEVAQQVREMLLDVCERGTGKLYARSNWYKVGGKTGTAKKVINGAYSKSHRVLSFAGFAPAEKPAIVVVVLIDEPEKLRFGATAAAPVFREIVENTLPYLHVPPDFLEPRLEKKNSRNRKDIRPEPEKVILVEDAGIDLESQDAQLSDSDLDENSSWPVWARFD